MRHIAALLISATLAAPAAAAAAAADAPSRGHGEGERPQVEVEEGFGLLEEGARIILRGLLDQFEPKLRDFAEQIDDLGAYHAPEVLPNGDILLRRKQPGEGELSPPPDFPQPQPEPEVEPEPEPERQDPGPLIDL